MSPVARPFVVGLLGGVLVIEYVASLLFGLMPFDSLPARPELEALAWTAVAVFGVLCGVTGTVANRIEVVKRMEEPLLALPVSHFEIECSRMLLLIIEGFAWLIYFVLPILVLALSAVGACWEGHLMALGASICLLLFSIAGGVISANVALRLLRVKAAPRVLKWVAIVAVVTVGVCTSTLLTGGQSVLRLAMRAVTVPWLPMSLAHSATQAILGGRPAFTCIGLLFLSSIGMIALAVASGRMSCDWDD